MYYFVSHRSIRYGSIHILARAVCAMVYLSVTSQSCIKTDKRIGTQTMPHDSLATPVFCCQRQWVTQTRASNTGCPIDEKTIPKIKKTLKDVKSDKNKKNISKR